MQYPYKYFIQKFTDAFKLSRVYPSNLIFCAQKFTESIKSFKDFIFLYHVHITYKFSSDANVHRAL